MQSSRWCILRKGCANPWVTTSLMWTHPRNIAEHWEMLLLFMCRYEIRGFTCFLSLTFRLIRLNSDKRFCGKIVPYFIMRINLFYYSMLGLSTVDIWILEIKLNWLQLTKSKTIRESPSHYCHDGWAQNLHPINRWFITHVKCVRDTHDDLLQLIKKTD